MGRPAIEPVVSSFFGGHSKALPIPIAETGVGIRPGRTFLAHLGIIRINWGPVRYPQKLLADAAALPATPRLGIARAQARPA